MNNSRNYMEKFILLIILSDVARNVTTYVARPRGVHARRKQNRTLLWRHVRWENAALTMQDIIAGRFVR